MLSFLPLARRIVSNNVQGIEKLLPWSDNNFRCSSIIILLLIEKKTPFYKLLEKVCFFSVAACFVLLMALLAGFIASSHIGINKSIFVSIFTAIQYISLILIIIRCIPKSLKRKWNWEWFYWGASYCISLFATGYFQ